MELHINDLSFQKDFVIDDKDKIINDFLDISEKMKHYFIEKIIVPADYMTKSIGQDFTFANSFFKIEDKEVDEVSSTHSRIRSLFANKFKIMQSAAEENRFLFWIQWQDQESEFLKAAYSLDYPVLSFRTHENFRENSFDVKRHLLDDQANTNVSDEKIKNISEYRHFVDHDEILKVWKQKQAILNGKWEPSTKPLRFIEEIKDYLKYIEFDQKKTDLGGDQRIAMARTVGRYIAEMNGWMYDGDLTRKNNRTVFKARNHTVYLSIDTETVTFELHDRRGNHLGEYNYYGKNIEDGKSHKLDVG